MASNNSLVCSLEASEPSRWVYLFWSRFVLGAFDELWFDSHFHHEFVKVNAFRVKSDEFDRPCWVCDEFTGRTGDVVLPVANGTICIDDHLSCRALCTRAKCCALLRFEPSIDQLFNLQEDPLDAGVSEMPCASDARRIDRFLHQIERVRMPIDRAEKPSNVKAAMRLPFSDRLWSLIPLVCVTR